MQKEQTPQPSHEAPEHAVPHDPVAIYKNKKVLALIAASVVILIGGGLAIMMLNKKEPSVYNEASLTEDQKTLLKQDDAFAQQFLRDCKERDVSFTHAPVPLDQLGYIEPMGKMYDGHVTPTDHVYIVPKNQQAADNTHDVVMPADGTVTLVAAMPAQYIGDGAQQVAAEDHRLAIAHNCKYVSIFIHVHQLSEALKTVVGTLEPNTNKEVSIHLKAGDKLGKIGGNPVDWSLMDATKTVAGFVTPDLYKSEPWKIHVIDPLSVYSGDTQTQLVAKSLRNAEPYGGKIDYDKKGALIGNWFREGTNGYMGADQSRYWDGHMAIVPDHIDPSGIIVSLGNWDGKAKQFAAKNGSADPANITPASGAIKYELSDVNYAVNGQPWAGRSSLSKDIKLDASGQTRGTILVQVMDGEKLKVELFPGKSAAQVNTFTANAQTYVR